MKVSSTPILLAIQLAFLFLLARRGDRPEPARDTMVAAYGYFAWLSTFAIFTTVLGARGVFLADALLPTLPGLWLPLLGIGAAVAPVLVSARLRTDLRHIADVTPWHWFAYFHALRIAAVGTLYKTAIGEFPVYFEIGVGIPDLLFGTSALWIAGKAKRGELTTATFAMWNTIGVMVIVPGAPLLLQLGLPGPLQVFTTVPDSRALLTYPMSIAPMMVVPLFVLINLWVVWRLAEQGLGNEPTRTSGPPGRRHGETE